MAVSGAQRKVYGACLAVESFQLQWVTAPGSRRIQPTRRHVQDRLDIPRVFVSCMILRRFPLWTFCAGSGKLTILVQAWARAMTEERNTDRDSITLMKSSASSSMRARSRISKLSMKLERHARSPLRSQLLQSMINTADFGSTEKAITSSTSRSQAQGRTALHNRSASRCRPSKCGCRRGSSIMLQSCPKSSGKFMHPELAAVL
mmetsp:Transcript_73299/g.122392  ORF Transcript_73299/g.122392 Transcript_73299/m.122392 type:complete len:204 (-) Transcript_73299:295-906(-)